MVEFIAGAGLGRDGVAKNKTARIAASRFVFGGVLSPSRFRLCISL